MMTPMFLNKSGYSSCIKIAGIPILPPLITDERRNELKEEKAKAIEIEKRIKRKRTSIDSGVMTGSYIDNFKNGETLLAENSTCHELSVSDLTSNGTIIHKPLSESNSTDSFLKAALEDSEFREFFYSTAEKIFKDNKLDENTSSHYDSSVLPESTSSHYESSVLPENTSSHYESSVLPENTSSHYDSSVMPENTSSHYESSVLPENQNPHKIDSYNKEMNIEEVSQDSNITSHLEPLTQQSNILDLKKDDLRIPTCFTDKTRSEVEIVQQVVGVNMPCTEVKNQTSPYPGQRVRRNSYTLDSPSPVLLEHMAKGNTPPGKVGEDWHVLSEPKIKGLGFKTFMDTKKQRKTWNKNSKMCSPPKVDISPDSKIPNILTKKSKTFVKTDKLLDNSNNYSLPSSSCSSPTRLTTFAYSSDCIQSVYKNSMNCINTNNFEVNVHETNKQNEVSKVLHQSHVLENETMFTDKSSDSTLECLSKDLPNTLSVNSTSVSSGPNYDTLLLFPSKDFTGNSFGINAFNNHSSFIQQNPHDVTVKENQNVEHKKVPSNDMDDTLSVCSSLSLSKFMLVDDNLSRPSTAEDLSVLFSELQLRHERQIAELLEMQHKEKIILSKMHSNSGSISSQSTANFSVSELAVDNNSLPGIENHREPPIEKRTPFNRELFPTSENNRSPQREVTHLAYHHHNSEKEKKAASKLTACVRGYLTRRLLKTERVQQLIDTIKESLNCAFSLQSETELRKNDLELHERLAHQLTAALYELQSIISAPVATRMAVIAIDREKLRKPVSRPSSAISSATQKSILRRQKSLNNSEKKTQENNQKTQEIRPRTKSLCLLGTSGTGSVVKSDSLSTCSSSINRKPWR